MVTVISGLHEVNAEPLVHLTVREHACIDFGSPPILFPVYGLRDLRLEDGLPLVSAELLPHSVETVLLIKGTLELDSQLLTFRVFQFFGLDDKLRLTFRGVLHLNLLPLVSSGADVCKLEVGRSDEFLRRQVISLTIIVHVVSFDYHVLSLLKIIKELELLDEVRVCALTDGFRFKEELLRAVIHLLIQHNESVRLALLVQWWDDPQREGEPDALSQILVAFVDGLLSHVITSLARLLRAITATDLFVHELFSFLLNRRGIFRLLLLRRIGLIL